MGEYSKDGKEIERLQLKQSTMVCGRHDQSDLVFLHPTISRQHAAFVWKETGELYVRIQ